MKGLIHIYTGDGKGKTTCAIGLGIRAYGNDMKVLMVQFLKGTPSGEINTIKKLGEGFILHRGRQVNKFIWNMNEEEKQELKQIVREDFKYAYDAAMNNNCDMLIMDELLGTITNSFIQINEVLKLLENKPEGLEIVITGRNAPSRLIERADYVSEIKLVKHPFQQGIPARRGVEF